MSATSQSTIGITQFGPYTAEPYRYLRRPTRVVMVGDAAVGGTNPIRVQSMTTTPTQDVDATYAQTVRLVDAGYEIVRVTTPSTQDARALGEVRRRNLLPDTPLTNCGTVARLATGPRPRRVHSLRTPNA